MAAGDSLAIISPISSARLGVEIDYRRCLLLDSGSNRLVQGKCGLSRTTFLGDNCEGLHIYMVECKLIGMYSSYLVIVQ